MSSRASDIKLDNFEVSVSHTLQNHDVMLYDEIILL